jgi:hypothetical protein
MALPWSLRSATANDRVIGLMDVRYGHVVGLLILVETGKNLLDQKVYKAIIKLMY